VTNELVTVTNVVSRDISGLDVMNSVNEFYSGAFDKLFEFVLALIALFGVVLPILFQVYQKRALKGEMATLFDEKKTDLLKQIGAKFEEEKKNNEKSLAEKSADIEKKLIRTEGYTFQIQGNMLAEQKHYLHAAESYLTAARRYCKSESGENLINILTVCLINGVLPKLLKKDIEKDSLKEGFDKLIKQLTEINKNGFLSDSIRKFEEALSEARKREK
jgi:hypothetical protein